MLAVLANLEIRAIKIPSYTIGLQTTLGKRRSFEFIILELLGHHSSFSSLLLQHFVRVLMCEFIRIKNHTSKQKTASTQRGFPCPIRSLIHSRGWHQTLQGKKQTRRSGTAARSAMNVEKPPCCHVKEFLAARTGELYWTGSVLSDIGLRCKLPPQSSSGVIIQKNFTFTL